MYIEFLLPARALSEVMDRDHDESPKVSKCFAKNADENDARCGRLYKRHALKSFFKMHIF